MKKVIAGKWYILWLWMLLLSSSIDAQPVHRAIPQKRPNVIFIYTDHLGYGDVSCYGAAKISTPNPDRLASQGIRFTNAHSPPATCTPSRYALMTGRYLWRQKRPVVEGRCYSANGLGSQ